MFFEVQRSHEVITLLKLNVEQANALAVRLGRFILSVCLFSACFTVRVGFYQRCFTGIDDFRFSLNSKSFIEFSLYYKKLFLSLQRLRIGSNWRQTPERKAKG